MGLFGLSAEQEHGSIELSPQKGSHINRNAICQASSNWQVVANDPFKGGTGQKPTYPKQIKQAFLFVSNGWGASTLHMFNKLIVAKRHAFEEVVFRTFTNGHWGMSHRTHRTQAQQSKNIKYCKSHVPLREKKKYWSLGTRNTKEKSASWG